MNFTTVLSAGHQSFFDFLMECCRICFIINAPNNEKCALVMIAAYALFMEYNNNNQKIKWKCAFLNTFPYYLESMRFDCADEA